MSPNWKQLSLAAAGLTSLVILAIPSLSLKGDEPSKERAPNIAKADPNKPKADKVTRGVARLGLAYNLIAYGREAKSPEALILAAKILGTTPTRPGDDKFKQEEGLEVKTFDLSPAKLIAEAKEMSDNDDVTALANSASRQISERSRGELDGPREHQGGVRPNGVATWNGVFRGGELASVTVAGYGNADLDLYIYDDRGFLITQDSSPDYNPTCTWRPIYTGKFLMKVVNCSPYGAGFRLIHN